MQRRSEEQTVEASSRCFKKNASFILLINFVVIKRNKAHNMKWHFVCRHQVNTASLDLCEICPLCTVVHSQHSSPGALGNRGSSKLGFIYFCVQENAGSVTQGKEQTCLILSGFAFIRGWS